MPGQEELSVIENRYFLLYIIAICVVYNMRAGDAVPSREKYLKAELGWLSSWD